MFGVRAKISSVGRGANSLPVNANGVKSLIHLSSRALSKMPDWSESNAAAHQGGNHEFSASRSRDILDYGHEETRSSLSDNYQQASDYGQDRCDQTEKDRADLQSHTGTTSVSLNSCMQSNVPEPFNPQGRNPTHVNMPGGGVLRSQKYVYGDLHKYHPSRQFSTSATLQSLTAADMEVPCPQGVQGDDCVRFKLWYENCRSYNLSNCDEQLASFKTGRKTLAQIFTEQEATIKQVLRDYEKDSTDMSMQGAQGEADHYNNIQNEDVQGLQDSPPRLGGVESMFRNTPCPEGVQGSDCERFRIWLSNCSRFGVGNCQDQLESFKSGRKTLSQIFQEQDLLLEKIALQQRRLYSTESRGPEKPQPAEVSPEKLSQRQKLQRAVKQYGTTVIVFHVGISLLSLGGFYMAVSSGIDVIGILAKLGLGESILESRLATGASTFVVAYAVHKVFAPVRIAITLTATPFIVRYLRSIGFLKAPKV